MAKGRANPDWKRLVLEWSISGKTSKDWCNENNIPYNTLSGWKKRLKKQEVADVTAKSPTEFVELKDWESSESGIFLEYKGVKIHLKIRFDSSTLKQCLSCLRGG